MNTRKTILFTLISIFALFAVACSGAPADTMENMEHGDEHSGLDGHSGDSHDERQPNANGEKIIITAPEDGAEFPTGQDFKIEVEVENFELDNDGSHWHVYVDGTSIGMVMGLDYDQVIRELDPGMHEISVYIADGDHIEFEDGASIMVTITE